MCRAVLPAPRLRDLSVSGLKLDRSFTAGIRNGDQTCIKLSQV